MSQRLQPSDRSHRVENKPPKGANPTPEGRHYGAGTHATRGAPGISYFDRRRGKEKDSTSVGSSSPRRVGSKDGATTGSGGSPGNSRGPPQTGNSGTLTGVSRRKAGPFTAPAAPTTAPNHFPHTAAWSANPAGNTHANGPAVRGGGRTRRGGGSGLSARGRPGNKSTNSVNILMPPNNVNSLTGSVVDSQMFSPDNHSAPSAPEPEHPRPTRNRVKKYSMYNMEITQNSSLTIKSLYAKVTGEMDLGKVPVDSTSIQLKSAHVGITQSKTNIAEEDEDEAPIDNVDSCHNADADENSFGISEKLREISSNKPDPDLVQAHVSIELVERTKDSVQGGKENSHPAVLQDDSLGLDCPNHNQEDIAINLQKKQLAANEKEALREKSSDTKVSSTIESKKGDPVPGETGSIAPMTILAPETQDTTAQVAQARGSEIPTPQAVAVAEEKDTEEKSEYKHLPQLPTLKQKEQSKDDDEEESIEAMMPQAFQFQETTQDFGIFDVISPETRSDSNNDTSGVVANMVPVQPLPETPVKPTSPVAAADPDTSSHQLVPNAPSPLAAQSLSPKLHGEALDLSASPATPLRSHTTPGSPAYNLNLGYLVSAPALLSRCSGSSALSDARLFEKIFTPSIADCNIENGRSEPGTPTLTETRVNEFGQDNVTLPEPPQLSDTSILPVQGELPSQMSVDLQAAPSTLPLSTEIDLLESIQKKSLLSSGSEKKKRPKRFKRNENVTEMELLQAANRVTTEKKSKKKFNPVAVVESNRLQSSPSSPIPNRTGRMPRGSHNIHGSFKENSKNEKL